MPLWLLPAVALIAGLESRPADASEQDTRQQLEAVQEDLEAGRQRQQELAAEAERLAREARELQRQLVTAAREVQEAEARASEVERRLTELRLQEHVLQARLETRQGDLTSALSALIRLQRQPDVVVLANTGPTIEALRAGRLLASTSETLDVEARRLGRSLEELAALRADIAEEQRALAANAERLDAGRQRLGRLLSEKQARQSRLQAESAAEGQRLEMLTARAKDLKSLLKQLETETRKRAEEQAARAEEATRGLTRLTEPSTPDGAPFQPDFAAARGRLNLPATGTLVRSYGEETGSGSHARGITLMTRDQAQVVAPYDGEIVFSGPFRGYGVVLIISHGEGYHTLLAGLARTYVATGQEVLAGEPIGQMGRGTGENRSLYVELRRRGEAFDPRPWWADNRGKVSG